MSPLSLEPKQKGPGLWFTRMVTDPGPSMCKIEMAAYALKELPHPQVVLACGFLIANPDPCRLST